MQALSKKKSLKDCWGFDVNSEMKRANLLFRANALKESFYLVDLKENLLMDKLTELLAYHEFLDFEKIELMLDVIWLFSDSSSDTVNDNIERIDGLLESVVKDGPL
jgi:hypothetical protein